MAHKARGDLYLFGGKYKEAIHDYDESLELDPKSDQAMSNRCETRALIGDIGGALKDCNQAIAVKLPSPAAFDARGFVLLKSKRFDEAIADYDVALGLSPDLKTSLYGRGLAEQMAGQKAKGNADIAAVRKLDTNIAVDFARNP